MLHGGDYNLEQWLDRPEILEEDIRFLKTTNCNTVTIGVFAWSTLEPREGEYHLDWLENAIDRLYKNGIRVILATPSGSRPRWLAEKYPEVLRVDESRHRNLYGERHNHCYTAPNYRKKVRDIDRKLADRFSDHPAVILWHISNELGGECHCPFCQQSFRGWLKERYGTIEELNKRWCTTFWSHAYNDFKQVESPSTRGDVTLHGLNLDWKRFVTYQTLEFAKVEIEAIREGGSKIPVTTNLMYYYDGLDYQKFGEIFDVLSWDNYPTWHKKMEWQTAMDCGMFHDIVRSIKKSPFLLMESCPSSTNWQSVSKLKRPGMHMLSSMQAIAHGSDSVLYFQIRQSEGSSEKFHGAVIDHYGSTEGRVQNEVRKTGEALIDLGGICGSQVKAQAAVIYDWESLWAMNDAAGPRNKNLFAKESIQKSYQALRRMGLNVDVIGMGQDLNQYNFIAVPMLYLFKEDFVEKMKTFVNEGGTVVMTYWSGIVDQNDRCFIKGGGTPHGLVDVFGLRQLEIDALYEGELNSMVPVRGNICNFERSFTCEHLCELIELTTAEPIMVYEKDFYMGYPVVTRNKYGKGVAYYVATDAEEGFYEEFYSRIIKKTGIFLTDEKLLPIGLEVTTRENNEAEYIFIQNFNKKEIKLPYIAKAELIFGNNRNVIFPFETMIWKRSNIVI